MPEQLECAVNEMNDQKEPATFLRVSKLRIAKKCSRFIYYLQMASVRFTRNIQRHVECPTLDVPGSTLGEVLNAYFATNARARGYVLEDDGRLRKHMAVFIDGQQIEDRDRLSDSVASNAVVDVVQSLSGG